MDGHSARSIQKRDQVLMNCYSAKKMCRNIGAIQFDSGATQYSPILAQHRNTIFLSV